MMSYVVTNGYLTIEVSSFGAELLSIKNKKGKEFLWNGDPTFWKRRSPILFPFIGCLNNDEYRYKNKEYKMSKHGFARDKDFVLVEQKDHSITFSLKSSEDTKAIYPFDFELLVSYILIENSIVVKWDVKNVSEDDMFFFIGGHPAFLLPKNINREHTFISFDKPPFQMTDCSNGLARENSNVVSRINISRDNYLSLSDDLFKNDALVFENNQINRVCLCTKNKKPYLKMRFTSPVLGIWSPYIKDCPFVCIEPWYGRCDGEDYSLTLENKKWINHLPGNSTKEFSYQIEILK